MTVAKPEQSATITSQPPIEANLARKGMAASANQFVSQAAMAVLRDGGNAIDAAIAAAAVLMTVEPRNGHLGADTFFLINLAGSNQVVALNGSGAAPMAANREAYIARGGIPKTGLWATSVPGTIACWGTALERYGSKPLSSLLRTAIDYARDGVPVTPKLARMLANDADTYRQFPDAARVFVPDGCVPELGDTLRQPDLARSLERIATDGWQDFYRGKLAEQLVAYSQRHDGLFSLDDFANHETEAAEPVWLHRLRAAPRLAGDHRPARIEHPQAI
jgi:gamma-glutamyltranspeptidase/glutathione hydrolase